MRSNPSHRYRRLSIVLLFLAGALGACGQPDPGQAEGPLPPPAPTIVLAPTTSPTALPKALPTATPAPSPEEIARIIQQAVERADAAQIHQFEFLTSETTQQAGRKPFITEGRVSGELQGEDFHVVSREESRWSAGGHEYMRIGDTVYDRRLPGSGYSDDGQWFQQPYAEASRVGLVLLPTILGLYIHDVPFATFAARGPVALDGQACQRYVGEGPAARAALRAPGEGRAWNVPAAALTEPPAPTILLDQAEVTAMVCADGYLHEYRITMAGQDTTDQRVFATTVQFRLWGFGRPNVLAPPADARRRTLEPAP